MADRCLLFAAAALPNGDKTPVAAIGLCEVGYHYPVLFNLLVSADARPCHSLIFDVDEPFAIGGDAQQGIAKLRSLRARTTSCAEAEKAMDAAIAYLSQPHIAALPFIVLEPGELFGLSDKPAAQQLSALLSEVRGLRMEDVAALAANNDTPRDWPTEWTDILSFAPPSNIEPPIYASTQYIRSTPEHLLRHADVLASCVAENATLSFELGDPHIDSAIASLMRLPNLKTLTLHGPLAKLPDAVCRLKNLRTLVAGDLGLTALPPDFGALVQLEQAFLQCNAFTHFPDQLRKLNKLQFLSLWGNKIGAIPNWIGELEDLTQLLLEDCDLTSLPDTLFTLPALNTLNVLKNPRLSKLPETIGRAPSLETLVLSQCGLKDLPKGLASISSLRNLLLGDNQITVVAKEIRNMRLDTIVLSGNPMQRTPWTRWTFKARKVFL